MGSALMGKKVDTALEWGQLLLMLAVGAYFRFPGLGALSLYGDEDYTAVAVKAILSDGIPSMPSGMAYWRAAPYSYLVAVSAYLFNLNESSLRLPSAIFGIVAIPIFYLLARRLIGLLPATLSTWLLVFSAWHIDMSREGRMYSMFLALFLLCLFCFQKGFIEGQKSFRIVATLLAVVTLTLHELSILLVAFWCTPALFHLSKEKLKDNLSLFTTALGLSVLWVGYQKFQAFDVPGSMEVASRHTWSTILKALSGIQFSPKFWMLSYILDHDTILFSVLFLASVFVFSWVWIACRIDVHHNQYLIAGSAVMVILAIFNLFGLIALALLLLLFWRREKNRELLQMRYCRWIMAEVGVIFIFWSFYGLMGWKGEGVAIGSEIDVVRKVAKDSLYYPALHILLYFEAFPVMTVTVVLGTLTWAFLREEDVGTKNSEAILFPWFWFPILLLGFKTEWIALRYTIMVYPFFLMLFAWTIHRGFRWGQAIRSYVAGTAGAASEKFACAVAQLVVLPVVLLVVPVFNEQHSIRAAIQTAQLSYAQYISPLLHGFPFHPDHKGPGEYVKVNLEPNDFVIAMDVVQQYHYAGRVNYWLSSESDKKTYSYRKGNVWYDIYTRSPVITQRQELEQIFKEARGRVRNVWLVTSGESADRLSSDLIEFIRAHNSNVVFIGRDNKTSVYRFDITT